MRFADTLLDLPNCRIVQPGPRHWTIFRDLCQVTNASGNLVPDAWLADGRSTIDLFGDGFTLLRLGADKADASHLRQAFGALAAPLAVLDIDGDAARSVYGFDYLLVRPDLHVVWRGNALPADAGTVARVVTGH